MTTASISLAWQLPLHRTHKDAGAEFVEFNGYKVPSSYADQTASGALTLRDLTAVARFGIKGKDTMAVLADMGISIADPFNKAFLMDDGSLALNLGPTEALFLGRPDGTAPKVTEDIFKTDKITYSMPRQHSHYWLQLTGYDCADCLAKLCAIDFRSHKFANMSVAQTSLARTTVFIIREDVGDTPSFHIFGDIASSDYIWSVMVDAIGEFDGQLKGFNEA